MITIHTYHIVTALRKNLGSQCSFRCITCEHSRVWWQEPNPRVTKHFGQTSAGWRVLRESRSIISLKMVKMKPETKKRVQTVIKFSKTAFHWGFIPFIIYLGKCTTRGLVLLIVACLACYHWRFESVWNGSIDVSLQVWRKEVNRECRNQPFSGERRLSRHWRNWWTKI